MVDYLVKIRRSACVVKGGRRFSFNALVVVGDKLGKVSFGYAKANEVPPAVEKAIKEGEQMARRAKKVQLKGKSIPHRVIGKFGATRVILVPAGPGTGVKAGPGVREVLQAAGIEHTFNLWPGGHDGAYWNAHVEDYLRFYGSAFRTRPPRSLPVNTPVVNATPAAS